jgi:FKBP-type peptidyl-prolyl cis-trans isomerase
MMKAGSHWKIYLPYLQAYGEKSAVQDPRHGFKVGPDSELIFDVELESIRPSPPARGMPPGMGGAPMATTPGVTATPQPAHPPMNTTPPGAVVSMPVTSSGIVRVPSAAEAEKGEKPRVMTDAEVEAAKQEAAKQEAAKQEAARQEAARQAATNAAAPK